MVMIAIAKGQWRQKSNKNIKIRTRAKGVEGKGEDNLTIATAVINSLISTFNYTNQDLMATFAFATVATYCFSFSCNHYHDNGSKRSENNSKRAATFVVTMEAKEAEGKEIKIQKIRANLRIGPHNKNIFSILFGSLLGDAHAELRLKGTRITFFQEGSHVSYLIWLHKLISELGYCNTK